MLYVNVPVIVKRNWCVYPKPLFTIKPKISVKRGNWMRSGMNDKISSKMCIWHGTRWKTALGRFKLAIKFTMSALCKLSDMHMHAILHQCTLFIIEWHQQIGLFQHGCEMTLVASNEEKMFRKILRCLKFSERSVQQEPIGLFIPDNSGTPLPKFERQYNQSVSECSPPFLLTILHLK